MLARLFRGSGGGCQGPLEADAADVSDSERCGHTAADFDFRERPQGRHRGLTTLLDDLFSLEDMLTRECFACSICDSLGDGRNSFVDTLVRVSGGGFGSESPGAAAVCERPSDSLPETRRLTKVRRRL